MAVSKRGTMSLSRDIFWDRAWLALPATSQALYLTIAADSFTSRAGIAPVTLRRWSNHFGDQTCESISEALDHLVAGDRAVLDYDPVDPNVLLPKLLIDNGSCAQPNAVASAIKSARECRSDMLRERFAAVVAELPARESGLALGLVEKKAKRAIIPSALRLSVYQRDDWTCQDCGRRILPTGVAEESGERAPFDDTGWLELDHIHPHSDGGEDAYENLRALCSRCNRVKGVRRVLSLPSAVTI